MLPSERASRLPRAAGGGGTRTRGRTRTKRPALEPPPFSTGAPATSFAPTPLRTSRVEEGMPNDVEQLLVFFNPPSTSTPMPSRPMAPAAPVQAPPPPRNIFAAEELADLDPFGPSRRLSSSPAVRYSVELQAPPPAVQYDIPYGQGARVIPSFEPTPQETLEMLEAAVAPMAQRQEYTEPPRIAAPLKLEIPMEERPRVIPSFECSPELIELTSDMLEEEAMSEATPPCAVPQRQSITTPCIPTAVRLEIPVDDSRRPRVIPSYERTPEEMLPPEEPPPSFQKKRKEKQSIGGVAYDLAYGERPRRSTVRHSFEGEEEAQLGLEEPAYALPAHLQARLSRRVSRPQTQQRETRPQTQQRQTRPQTQQRQTRPQTQQRQARPQTQQRQTRPQTQHPPPVPKTTRSRGIAGYGAAPRRPSKVDPISDRTPEEKIPRKKPPPPEPETKTGTVLQVGPGVTHGSPPEACVRKITSMYYSKPPQQGATLAKVHEEIVEVHGEPQPETEQEMMRKARRRMAQEAAAPHAGDHGRQKPATSTVPKAKSGPVRNKKEAEMMALARRRMLGEVGQQTTGGALATVTEQPVETEEEYEPQAGAAGQRQRGYQGKAYNVKRKLFRQDQR